MSDGIEIWTEVVMLPEGETQRTLQGGSGVNVVVDGLFYPGRVLRCEPPIPPGGRGAALVGILTTPEFPLRFEAGSRFELRNGPRSPMATATVLAEAALQSVSAR